MGEALRALRSRNGWSLADVARMTGISTSALSKAENGRLSLTYDKLAALATGLGVDIATFFEKPPVETRFSGRRSIDRGDATAGTIETSNYVYHYLNTEILNKKMVPLVVEHTARTREEFGDFVRHEGEEFLYVLEGRLQVLTELYEAATLDAGQSVYLDSDMGHAYLNVGDGTCRTLAVVSAPAETINEALEPRNPSFAPRSDAPERDPSEK
ncbi:helix-turn-helix domain-containing protein [Aurantiacibacter gangjinensis]|uniref:helix-turn-helix domain-containing protein n=1 Tax=Aurantiacibacter gangjinensis TaxID=502682 RepID=UPI0009099E4C|nr:transcriptional regulator, HTH_3 family [Aurantiacibacter gangjinensis]